MSDIPNLLTELERHTKEIKSKAKRVRPNWVKKATVDLNPTAAFRQIAETWMEVYNEARGVRD